MRKLAMSIFKYWKDQNKKAEQNIRQKYFKIRHAYKKMEVKETKTELYRSTYHKNLTEN